MTGGENVDPVRVRHAEAEVVFLLAATLAVVYATGNGTMLTLAWAYLFGAPGLPFDPPDTVAAGGIESQTQAVVCQIRSPGLEFWYPNEYQYYRPE